jgi:hypothetical protein
LSLGFAAVVGLAAAALARAEAGGIKITALYGNPKNPEEFEKYYAGTHMPLVYDVKENVISALRPCGLHVALGRRLSEAECAMCRRTKQKNVK